MVNAPFLAKERGIEVREVKTEKAGDYHTLIRVSVKTDAGERSVAGTLFSNSEPRLVELFGIKVEAELAGHMMYIVNDDVPGFIGRVGTLLGEAQINIGTFNLGRREAGGEAVLLLSVDSAVPAEVVEKARSLPGVKRVMVLSF
jgi:D-3-phosphoglycerate dehydrogenase